MSRPAALLAASGDWRWVADLARLNAESEREAAALYLRRGLTSQARDAIDKAKAHEATARDADARANPPVAA